MFNFTANKYYSSRRGLVLLRYEVTVYVQDNGEGYIAYRDSYGRPCRMRFYKNSNGYFWVSLALQDKTKMSCRINRLVYSNLIGEIPRGLEVDHIDRNRLNNNPDNLRLVSRLENEQNKSRPLGEDKRESIITNEQAREICMMAVRHTLPRKKIAEKFGVSEATVKSIRAGRNWKFCTYDILAETNCK